MIIAVVVRGSAQVSMVSIADVLECSSTSHVLYVVASSTNSTSHS